MKTSFFSTILFFVFIGAVVLGCVTPKETTTTYSQMKISEKVIIVNNTLSQITYPILTSEGLETGIKKEIDDRRAQLYLPQLLWSESTSSVLREHSKYLASIGKLNITNSKGEDVDIWMLDQGINEFAGASYAVAVSHFSLSENPKIEEIVNSFIARSEIVTWSTTTFDSTGYLEPTFKKAGVGVYKSGNDLYITQLTYVTKDCGYPETGCCPATPGYTGSCYRPFVCVNTDCIPVSSATIYAAPQIVECFKTNPDTTECQDIQKEMANTNNLNGNETEAYKVICGLKFQKFYKKIYDQFYQNNTRWVCNRE